MGLRRDEAGKRREARKAEAHRSRGEARSQTHHAGPCRAFRMPGETLASVELKATEMI